ncbi:MAG: diguanylate cyclase [Prolixibacteraceae bacterium]|nr:diguanylate cyclase [Burkholderiales bacterium]
MLDQKKQSAEAGCSTDSRLTLRQQAEARAHLKMAPLPDDAEAVSLGSLRQTLHELRVHQIELEMQNDELRRSELELDAARALYFDLYDLAPVGYCTVSDTGMILQANLCAADLLGVARGALVEQPITRFILREDQDAYYLLRTQIMATGRTLSSDLRMVTPGGAAIWVHFTGTAAQDAEGAKVLRIVLSDINARKLSEAALHKSEDFNLAILDSLTAEIAVLNRDGVIVAVNQSWRGFALENRIAPDRSAPYISVGANYLAVCQSAADLDLDGALNALDGIRAVLEGRLPSYVHEYPCHSPEQQRWFSMNVTPFGDGVVIAHMDITERKRAEEALREQKEFFHLIAENIDDFIAVLDLDGRRLYNSPSYRHFFGIDGALYGSDSFADIHPDDREYVKQVFSETVITGAGRQINYRMLKSDGAICAMESSGTVIRDHEGQVARVVVVSRDVTERRVLEEQMRHLAFYDTLTGLPNRRLLNDRLHQALAASARSGCYGALMFLDLDNFKSLNDAHGHGVGDLLLIEAADRLKSCVREVDTVARFGGDEYVVMISEIDVDKSESRSSAESVAEKIRSTLAIPFVLKIKPNGSAHHAVEHHCTASIGIVLFVDHEGTLDDILRWADTAMYQAKEAGRNLIRFYGATA